MASRGAPRGLVDAGRAYAARAAECVAAPGVDAGRARVVVEEVSLVAGRRVARQAGAGGERFNADPDAVVAYRVVADLGTLDIITQENTGAPNSHIVNPPVANHPV